MSKFSAFFCSAALVKLKDPVFVNDHDLVMSDGVTTVDKKREKDR
jgi:hypothetical protein